MKEKGQVVVLMLLVMVIALAIGLSLISRSNVEVSTSRKSEDSSRAFSAAEAGIERAIKLNTLNLGAPVNVPSVSFSGTSGNQAGSAISVWGLPDDTHKAIEYPPFGKEGTAQFWLADPNTSPLAGYYPSLSDFDVYFGKPQQYGGTENPLINQPAIEVTVISKKVDGSYDSKSYFFDSYADTPARSTNFTPCASRCTSTTLCPGTTILTNNNSTESMFYCRVNVNGYLGTPMMAIVKMLYSDVSHPVALAPTAGRSLPKQLNLYRADGSSGNVRRTLEVFHQKSIMPQIFSYVLFSAQSLNK